MRFPFHINEPHNEDCGDRARLAHHPLAGANCEVQCGQRLAWRGMPKRQKGHSLVLGSATVASFLNGLNCYTSTKTVKATIRKLIMLLMDRP